MSDREALIEKLGKDRLLENLQLMLLIRHFETRAESAYLQGKVGGFFHSYAGQEAIQVAAVQALGQSHWYITSYRCHALALLLGASPEELMAELYGRANGNALGRGGSMHLYADRLMGGFGIVGGQIPIATGAAFALKYQGKSDQIAICFLGDGAVAQGAFHESLNLAALWDLPCLYVIENNHWGMGTAVEKAISVPKLAEDKAPGYGLKGYTVDGMDFFACYAAFEKAFDEMRHTGKPLLIEMITERFKGHSISDPALYRSKESLRELMANDPILSYKQALIETGQLDDEGYSAIDKTMRDRAIAAMDFADKSPWPEIATLEEDVFAPATED